LSDNPLLEARGTSRRFGYREIFRDVSLSVRPGEIVSLIGPNGAGKTTLLRMLAGLLKPGSGSVTRHGTLGMVSHASMLYDALTARENLEFFARLGGRPDAQRVQKVVERLDLARWLDQRVGTYSQGMRQRLAIARAILHEPKIILLDEPTSGLDEPSCRLVLGVLADLREDGCGMILVTHQYERVHSVSTSVGFLVDRTLHGPEPASPLGVDGVSHRYRRLLGHG
jgi:ABC-type multidrug transport system ATPase subunit